MVARAGGGIEIERALGVGAQAVKTVAFEGMVGETSRRLLRARPDHTPGKRKD